MDERVLRFRVGVVVVAAATVTVVLIMLFGAWPTILQRQYALHIKFAEAPGITVDTPVRKSGVLIGRVSEVKLMDEGGVLVTARINDRYRLRRNETCRVGSGSLLGDAVLEFVPSGQEELLVRFDANRSGISESDLERLSLQELTDGDFLSDGVVASNPLRVLVNLESSIAKAFASIETAGAEVSQLANTVNNSLSRGDGQIPRVLHKTELALDGLTSTMQVVNRVLGDEELSAQLQKSLREMPEFIAESRATMTAARSAMEDFQRVSRKAEVNLDNLERFTRPLGDRGEQLVQNVEASTESLNQILTQFVTFTEALNSGQGTISRLVHDDEVYQRVDNLVRTAEELSRRLRPIVEDVRIFTDKIARDPRQLGVKGALDQRPSGLKTGLSTW